MQIFAIYSFSRNTSFFKLHTLSALVSSNSVFRSCVSVLLFVGFPLVQRDSASLHFYKLIRYIFTKQMPNP